MKKKSKLYKWLRFNSIPDYILVNYSDTKYRNVRTVKGLPFDIAKSAVQKYIRRGIVDKAMYVALDVDMFKYTDVNSTGVLTNFYNRLRIILFEDIGLSAPKNILICAKLLELWRTSEKPSIDLVQAITIMCKSYHSRLYSHIRAYVRELKDVETHSYTIPFSLENDNKHRNLVENLLWCVANHDINAWYWAEKILNLKKLDSRWYNSTRPGFLILFLMKNYMNNDLEQQSWNLCKKWYGEIKAQEQFLPIMHVIYLVVLRKYTNWDYSDKTIPVDLVKCYDKVIFGNITIDDFVIDMHTKKGKQYKRNSVNFGVEGSLVAYDYRYKSSKLNRLSDIYIKQKLTSKPNTETSEFALKCRPQVTCSFSRPDVYFAKDIFGNNVVVKGPYVCSNGDLDYKKPLKIFKLQTILRLFKHINTYIVNIKLLYPDMFKSVPVGCRMKIKTDTPYYFVIMEDLVNMETYPCVKHTTKLWENESVVDFEKIHGEYYDFAVPSRMTDKAKISCIYQIAIRYAFQIGDFASRNFIRVKNKVYNLDVEDIFVGNSIKLKKSEKEILIQTFKKYKDKIVKTLDSWLYDVEWEKVKNILELEKSQINKIKEGILTVRNNYSKSLGLS